MFDSGVRWDWASCRRSSPTLIPFLFSTALPVALEVPNQRPVFLREYAVGTYSATSYFWARLPLELTLAFAQSLITLIIVYWLIEFRGNFAFYLLSWWALNVAAASFALILGCSVEDVKAVTEFLPPIFVPQMLFAGFFIRIEDIPIYLRWAQWLCSLKYTLNLVYLIEFTDECTDDEREACIDLREVNDVERDLVWLYVLVLVLLIVVFRIAALQVLVWRSKTVY